MERLLRGAAKMGIRLDAAQTAKFHRYYLEIVEGNRRISLTTVTGSEEVQVRHFLDSLTAGAAVPTEVLRHGGEMLDVGSGAGLPGIPLGIAYPNLRVTLLDATAKKTAFLAHVAQVLELDRVRVLTGRAELLAHDPELREGYDVVVSRAVARLRVLAELTLPFCRVGGTVIAQKGQGIEREIEDAGGALAVLGGELRELRQIAEPGSSEHRLLVVIAKVGPTSAKYPRRAGIPSKRPL